MVLIFVRYLNFQMIRFWKANPKSYLEGMKITDMVGNTLQLDSGAKKTNSTFSKMVLALVELSKQRAKEYKLKS